MLGPVENRAVRTILPQSGVFGKRKDRGGQHSYPWSKNRKEKQILFKEL